MPRVPVLQAAVVALWLVALPLAGCGRNRAPQRSTARLVPAPSASDSADNRAPAAAGSAAASAEAAPGTSGALDSELAIAQVLVQYRGCAEADSTVQRTRAEALAIAQRVCALARGGSADFAELARRYSDEPAGRDGGRLRPFRRGQMLRPVEDAAVLLAVGQISDPIETSFGFHVIRREPLERVRVAHIRIEFVGAELAADNVTRSRAEAHALVDSLLARAVAGEDFGTLARQYSEAADGQDGGVMPAFTRGKLVPAFEQAAFALPPGGISAVVETPYGFDIIRRFD